MPAPQRGHQVNGYPNLESPSLFHVLFTFFPTQEMVLSFQKWKTSHAGRDLVCLVQSDSLVLGIKYRVASESGSLLNTRQVVDKWLISTEYDAHPNSTDCFQALCSY